VAKRAPQVMVKVTGGGRGMAVIRAHMNYIDREGDGLIDQDGERHQGREARGEIARQWAREGTPIPERSDRREAFNITSEATSGARSPAAKPLLRYGHRRSNGLQPVISAR
jgi:hypothetical protein